MAGLGIFRKNYIVRRFGKQEVVKGYMTAPYQDFEVSLNVQPQQPHETKAAPEGERQFKKLKSFGDFQFTASDQHKGVQGDWLYYNGNWYCCISAVPWDHTLLHHNKTEWGAVGETELEEFLEVPVMKGRGENHDEDRKCEGNCIPNH